MSNASNQNKMLNGALALILAAVALLFVNIIVSRLHLRVDITEEKLYTLSGGTENILKELEEDVTIKYFFSRSADDLPIYLKDYARRVESKLSQYRAKGGGRVVVETYDPKPDTDEQDWAQRYGMQAQSLNPFEEPIYFGLVVISGDQEEAIPALSPRTENQLEYDISRAILRVTDPDPAVIGVLSSLPVMGGPQMPQMGMMPQQQDPPWAVFQYLQQQYEVVTVDPGAEEIAPEVKTLIVMHPKQLPDATLYAIDQFLLAGGNLVVMTDPLSLVDQMSSQQNQMAMFGGGQNFSSDMPPLFNAWGVGFDVSKVVADRNLATMMQMARGARPQLNAASLTLSAEEISREDLLTAQLEELWLLYAGSFTDQTADELTFSPLITSTPDQSFEVNAMTASFGEIDPRAKPDGKTHNLVVRLDGTFKTAFPGGRPAAEEEGAEEPAADDSASLKEGVSTVLLIGDADLLFNQIAMQEMNIFGHRQVSPRNGNAILLANAVEQFSGGNDLISIRSRQRRSRPLTKVDDLERKADVKFQEKQQELMDKLNETNQELEKLQREGDARGRVWRSKEQQAAIDRFNEQLADTQAELREVQKQERKDIETLGMWVRLLNTALIPLLVAAAGIIYGLIRRNH